MASPLFIIMLDTPASERPSLASLLEYRSSAFEFLTDAVMITSLDGQIIDWNSGATAMFGWCRAEMIGKTPAVLHRPEEAAELAASIHETTARGEHWAGEIAFVRKDGSSGITATTIIPMPDEQGRVFARIGVNRDITAKKAAEGKLIEEKQLLQTLIDALADPIFFKDIDGRYLLVNSAHLVRWNISREEVIGKTSFDIERLRDHADLYEVDNQTVIRTGDPIINREEPFTRTDGRQGWFLTSKFPLRDRSGSIIGIVGIARDITSRRAAEQELADEREKLRTILDALPDPVFVKDLEGRHILHNDATIRLFALHPEALGTTVYEMPLPREHADRYSADDRFVIETGTPIVNREEPFQLQDGGEGCLLTSKFPLRDSGGSIVGLIGIGRDITQIRRDATEREALQAKLRETQKLESLGVLAGGIAHDFNNLLGVILGNASIALNSKRDPDCRPFLEQIETAASRAADLCRQMLAYSGRGNLAVHSLDLNSVIRETANLLRVSIGKGVELRTLLAPELPAVIGDETQLRQVIMNLVINASEAIGDRSGSIRLSTSTVHADESYLKGARMASDMKPGHYVSMEVSDDGHGMPSDVIDRIFDPFFTTKFTGRGLGLAAVLGIVRSHRGGLKIQSEPGVGSTFKMLIPCASETQISDLPRQGGTTLPWRGTGTALVVDDEEPIRKTVAEMLKKMGFVPQLASDGIAALSKFTEKPDAFTLIVMDLTMPGLDGLRTSSEIRRIRNDVPILLMSGFNEREVVGRFQGHRQPGFIHKPFTMPAFREKVRATLLDEAAAL